MTTIKTHYIFGRSLLLWVAIVLSTIFVSSQDNALDVVPFQRGNHWGYVNQNSDVIISPEYDEAGFFDLHLAGEAWAVVKANGKYGAVSRDGQIKLPFLFDSILQTEIRRSDQGTFVKVLIADTVAFTDYRGTLYADPPGVRPWMCGGVFVGREENELIVEENWQDVIPGADYNYQYTERKLIDNGERKTEVRETVQVMLDSLISVKARKVMLLYRQDGKINVCRQFNEHTPHPVSLCLGFKYDETAFIKTNIIGGLEGRPPIRVLRNKKQIGYYESIFRVRTGDRWGLIDLRGFEPDYIPMPYQEVWETVPVKYLSIEPSRHRYFLVEYEPGKHGYIKLTPSGKVKEYWPLDDVGN